MKDNQLDEVMKRVLSRVDKTSDLIAQKFKGIKPFAEKPVPVGEMLKAFDGLTAEDMQFFIQRHGEEAVNELIQDMEKERLKQLEKTYESGGIP